MVFVIRYCLSKSLHYLTYFSTFPFHGEFICLSLPLALVTVSVSSSCAAGPVSETESVYTKQQSEQYTNKSPAFSPFWTWAVESSRTFCPDALTLLRICWSCSWVKHTKLSFMLLTLDVSLADSVLLSDGTLTTPMTLQRSVLLCGLVFRLPCSAWLTPLLISLHFLSLCHLSSALGPSLEMAVAFSCLFFGGTWY